MSEISASYSLPDRCFCFRGEPLNLPEIAFNAKDVPYIKPIYDLPPVADLEKFVQRLAVQISHTLSHC